MITQIVVLSGHIASGKTTLASALVERHQFLLVKTRELLHDTLDASGRFDLQAAGERLDRKTRGAWLADAVIRRLSSDETWSKVVIDSVRIGPQVDALRRAFGSRVVHVHMLAPEKLRRSRYRQRADVEPFERVMSNRTEQRVDALSATADIVVDTERNLPEDVLTRVASRLGLYGRAAERLVDVLVGGQYGSEGKGHVASYLARPYACLVRVGGPNAGHKVCEEDGTIYTFHQLPSGTKRTSAAIVLGPGAVLSIDRLITEIRDCRIEPARLSVDPQALVIERQDIRAESGALVKKIGSTGQGVGAATARKVLRSAAKPAVRLAKDIPELAPYIRDSCEVFDRLFAHGERIFVEGTQGSGLSLHHGTFPSSRRVTRPSAVAWRKRASHRVGCVESFSSTAPIRFVSRILKERHRVRCRRSLLGRRSVDDQEFRSPPLSRRSERRRLIGGAALESLTGHSFGVPCHSMGRRTSRSRSPITLQRRISERGGSNS